MNRMPILSKVLYAIVSYEALTILPKLIYLFYSTKKATPKLLPVWLKNLLLEMDKPENYTVGLKRMLQLSNISQEHLNREFRRFLGLTPTEYINSRRIHYAGQLRLNPFFRIRIRKIDQLPAVMPAGNRVLFFPDPHPGDTYYPHRSRRAAFCPGSAKTAPENPRSHDSG